MLVKQMNRKSVIFVNISFLDKELMFQTYGSNGCHDSLMMSINLDDFVILSVKCVDYRCITSLITKMQSWIYRNMLI